MYSLSLSSVAAVAVAVASVYREPDKASEVVTQALLNTPAQVVELGDSPETWVRIRLSDYEGWLLVKEMAEVAGAKNWQATVLPLCTTIYADSVGDAVIGKVYSTTSLPASEKLEGRVLVQLPGGASGWLETSAVELRPADTSPPEHGPEVAISLAQQLLGTPYLWGGTTVDGIDCSGLTQLCCRAAGVTIPRDGDQQYEGIPYVVPRCDLRAGDLVYFASHGKITHTALMIDPRCYIHAKGDPENRVILTGLEPGETGYNKALAGHYAGARRPFVRNSGRILV